MKTSIVPAFLGLFLFALLALGGCKSQEKELTISLEARIKKDQEKSLPSGKKVNSSTQSVNRYHSDLRKLEGFYLNYSPSSRKINVELSDSSKQLRIQFNDIDGKHLVPLLPYTHEANIDHFDMANLVLAEYSRNGVELSYQEENTEYAFFKEEGNLFDDRGEYFYDGTKILPNPKVRPLRMSMINNCLHPGLWEISARDAVGEMYHGWVSLPEDEYFSILKAQNNIANPIKELQDFFKQENWDNIPLELDRFRTLNASLFKTKAQIAVEKKLGGYSSQDSRRKIQRGFSHIFRQEDTLNAAHLGDLQENDEFQLHSFIPPGIYDHQSRFRIPYDPNWEKVEVNEVLPKTSYGHDYSEFKEQGFLEFTLQHKTQNQALIVGNIPVKLLVFSNDYVIPSFGVGVLSSSELVERRHFRLKSGPPPHYAYLIKDADSNPKVLNNHSLGYEQIYIRPFKREDKIWIRFTVVSYERIVDLLEFEFPVEGELAKKIIANSANYSPPFYEVYADDNTL